MSKQNWEKTVNLLLTYLNEGRIMQETPESRNNMKEVLGKEQEKRLHEQIISGRFDPCDPGDMVRVCSEIFEIKKDSDAYQDLVLQVRFFVLTNAPSSPVVNPTWQTDGRPVPPPPPAPKNTLAGAAFSISGNSAGKGRVPTISPPVPISDRENTRVVRRSLPDLALEEMVAESEDHGSSLTAQLAAIQAENIKLETDLAAIQAENKKLETEVSEAKKAADGLEKSKKACLGELDSLCHVISGYQAHIEEEKNNRPVKEAEIAQVMDERRALEEQLAQAQDSLQKSQRALEEVKNEAYKVEAGLEEYKNKVEEEYESADQRQLAAKEKLAEAEALEARAKKMADEAQVRIDEIEAQPTAQAIVLTTLSNIGMPPDKTNKFLAARSDAEKYAAVWEALILMRNFLQQEGDNTRDKIIELQDELDKATKERDALEARCAEEIPEQKRKSDEFREKIAEIEEYTNGLREESRRRDDLFREEADKVDLHLEELDRQTELRNEHVRAAEADFARKKQDCEDLTATLAESKKSTEVRISALTTELAQTISDAEHRMHLAVNEAGEFTEECFKKRIAALDYVEKLELQELDRLKKIYQAAILEKERHIADLTEQVEGIGQSRQSITAHSEREIQLAEKELEAALEVIAKSAQCPEPAEPADTAAETVERR
jgi:chromosome segregation ATPase